MRRPNKIVRAIQIDARQSKWDRRIVKDRRVSSAEAFGLDRRSTDLVCIPWWSIVATASLWLAYLAIEPITHLIAVLSGSCN